MSVVVFPRARVWLVRPFCGQLPWVSLIAPLSGVCSWLSLCRLHSSSLQSQPPQTGPHGEKLAGMPKFQRPRAL